MGWERFLKPGEDPTDEFTQHRAQMRHYGDYMLRREEAASALSPRSSSTGGGGGGGGGGGALAVAGPHVVQEVAAGGPLTIFVDGPGKADPVEQEDWGVYGRPPGVAFHDETRTSRTLPGPFGPITIYAHPDATDVEMGAEARLGDGPMSWLYGVWTDAADWAYTASRADPEVSRIIQQQEIKRAEMFRQAQPVFQSQWDDFNSSYPLFPPGWN